MGTPITKYDSQMSNWPTWRAQSTLSRSSAKTVFRSGPRFGGVQRRNFVFSGVLRLIFGCLVPWYSLPVSVHLVCSNIPMQVISLIWGDNFFIFKPNVPQDHTEYELQMLTKYHIYFGPYPSSYTDLADDETLAILSDVMDSVSPKDLRPFTRASKSEISTENKESILKIMRLDPRDRPTAKELLDDEWFYGT